MQGPFIELILIVAIAITAFIVIMATVLGHFPLEMLIWVGLAMGIGAWLRYIMRDHN